ncbi:MAG: aminotransferase class I/II-fold pyridoxal phosphate-dependent enzyme [Thermoproteota archaeon]|nr:aminotransferase class I/II-fold pyridoxal phosphate-dependent enzyme [Thermoproteota archaeon]
MSNNTNEEKELESLRDKVREVTIQIMCNVQQRTELVRKIGEIKGTLGIDIKDEKVEHDVRTRVLSLANQIGMREEFALQLLNILLAESEYVQVEKQPQKIIQKQTHLSIFAKAKQLEASGKKIIHMEVGEPDYSPPAVVGKSLAESFGLRQYHYTDTCGISELRDSIAIKHGIGVSKEQVIVTPGGRFAVFSAITSLLKAGQELIIVQPAWPAYKECADMIGIRTRMLNTTFENKWHPDIEQLQAMINPSTRMIALNYPNNPTGKVLDSRTLERIVKIADDHNLYLLSDEVYADYSFVNFNSIVKYAYDKSILIGSFSKRYAMTGFRVGYGIANKEIISKMAKVQAAGITSVAQPMQQAALAALEADPSENIKLMKRRLDFVCSKLKGMSLRFIEPEGAMYVFAELPYDDDIPIVEKLLGQGVAIAPGSGFGNSYKQFVRISACQSEDILEKGLNIMASVIREDS